MGLGNPGEKYAQNRHNVGFMFAEWLLDKMSTSPTTFAFDKYSDADIAKIQQDSSSNLPAILAKPRTYMNRSGFTANKLIATYSIQPTSLFVAHDDLDIKLGEFKIQQGKGPKIHNGLSSIESSLHFKDFWRIRIGIDNRDPAHRIPGEPYVLQNFSPQEMKTVTEIFPIIFQKLQPVFEAQEQS